jgi:hypothetical protein
MSTYTFTTISTGRISIDAGTFYAAPDSTQVEPTWDKANRVSLGFLGISLNIDATKDTVVIDGTSHAPNFYTGATLYSALVTLFRKANSGSGGSGLSADGTYTPDATTHYLTGATSLTNADKLLDTQVFNNSNRTALFLGALTSTQRDALSSPTAGSMLFNTTTGVLEKYEDSVWTWMPVAGMGDTLWNAKYGFDYFRNFTNINNDVLLSASTVNGGAVASSQAQSGFTSESAGSGGLYTGAAANGRASIISNVGSIILGGGITMVEARIYILNLSNSTDRYVFYSGFSNNTTGIDPTNGIGIFYDEGGVSAGSTASPNWQLSVSNNNTRTIVATTVPVAAATWYKLRIEVNAAGTGIKFFVNDVYVNPSGDITTNIPVGQTRSTGINTFIHKSIGTTSRGVLINTARFRQKYTNSR